IINEFVGIRASFHESIKNVKHEIIITPKMSFGTGHHATTFLMIEQMEKINFKNKTVIDFGTGTGILAILAEKLGAASITAIDNDEWSINNAFENIESNHCKLINLEKRNNIEGLSFVNIILANINFNVLAENAKNLSMFLLPKSLLVISGFLLKDEKSIEMHFVKNNFVNIHSNEKNEWIVMVLEKC
ncbi:MAG: 50S ribosomal protein L11 methyltransferase, partial [Ginsengibacter sp.]